jgi:hypothetical protein
MRIVGKKMENDIKNQIIEKVWIKMSNDYTIPAGIISSSTSLALSDDYLLDLLSDWLDEKNDYIKHEMLKEIINYTDEMARIKSL